MKHFRFLWHHNNAAVEQPTFDEEIDHPVEGGETSREFITRMRAQLEIEEADKCTSWKELVELANKGNAEAVYRLHEMNERINNENLQTLHMNFKNK